MRCIDGQDDEVSRLFDGTDDLIDDAGITTLAVTGALTFLVVVKFVQASGWEALIECETNNAGLYRCGITRNSGTGLRFADETSFSDAGSFADSDGWIIAATTKATGTATPDHHKIVIGGSRTTSTGSAAVGSGNSTTVEHVKLGGDDDPAEIYLGAAAIFSKVLTITELDGINTAKTGQAIFDLGPIWFADYGNSFATEIISGRSLTISGTTTSSDDPSGWVYYGAAAATKAPIWNPARYALTKR